MEVNGVSSSESCRYAVTGAGGFIGQSLVRWLADKGVDVIAVVRSADQRKALAELSVEVRVADVRNPDELATALDGATGVFHLAALFNHAEKTWDDYRSVNVRGTLNVLETAKRTGVERVVHCSTIGVVADSNEPPFSEQSPYGPKPDDKYEVTKCEGEQAAKSFAAENDFPLVIVRPAQVYGPGNRSKVKFYKMVQSGVIVSPGRTNKHMVYIDDLCEAFYLAMVTPHANGEVFVIAGPGPTSLHDVIAIAAECLGVRKPKIQIPAMPTAMACRMIESICSFVGLKPVVARRQLDFFTQSVECEVSKAHALLGFRGRVSVADGIRATVGWYRDEGLL